MRNKLIYVLLLIFLFSRKFGNSVIITGCQKLNDHYLSYGAIELSCNGLNSYDYTYSHGYSNCYSAVFSTDPNEAVLKVRTGDCRGPRLNKTLADFMPNVNEYDVSFHEIEMITSEDLCFRSLIKFNASHNKLTDLTAGLFIHSPRLHELDFAYNSISNLKSEVISDLKELKLLNLSYNSIQTIENGIFKNNVELATLNLIGNPMKHFDCNTFNQHTRMFKVYIFWSDINELSANCMKERETLSIELNENMISFSIIELPQYDEYTEYTETTFTRKMIITDNVGALKYLNISGNDVDILEALRLLQSEIEILDASKNSIYTKEIALSDINNFNNLKFLNLSHLGLWDIGDDSFQNMLNLTTLDISNNLLKTIKENWFKSNTKLENVYLQKNFIKKIDCAAFSLIKRGINMHISFDDVIEINTSCLENSIKIDLNNENKIIFHGNGLKLNCTKVDFKQLKSIKLSGNQLENTNEIIEALGTSVEKMDVSRNFIGALKVETFEKFDNLQYLNLSSTNLSNFGFPTFYHQNKLLSLDLSNNNLMKVDFTLLMRNFHSLITLKMEGNNLTEINTIIPLNFPQLTFLGISKNRFSCKYLVNFLLKWPDLHLIHNPSNQQTHISGTDCVHEETIETSTMNVGKSDFGTKSMIIDKASFGENTEKINTEHQSNFILEELRALKYLFVALLILCCGYFVVKSQTIQRIREFSRRNPMENTVSYNQNEETHQGQVQLIDERQL